MSKRRFLLDTLACACALGRTADEIAAHLQVRSADGLTRDEQNIPGRSVFFGGVLCDLPTIAEPAYDIRTNRLLSFVLQQKRTAFDALVARYGADRVAVILGTSNTGVDEAERAVERWLAEGRAPATMHFAHLELGTPADFLAHELGITGPAYSISTACSSSAKVFSTAARLIESGVVDAAIVGGADGRCRFALNGFHALGALSAGRCRPLAPDRDGINLGEGAVLFTFEREADAPTADKRVFFSGAGETSDAYHITAPDPEGRGAEAAMRSALLAAACAPHDVGYVNLHGTGTIANDAMELKALERVFDLHDKTQAPWYESTKDLTGHCLGAAGAIEAAICWLRLKSGQVRGAALSNSFAFGGSNAAVLFEAE